MRRGEVWWASLEPPIGRRPVLLLSRDEAYTIRSRVIVAPITTRIRSVNAEVPLGPEDGLTRQSVANLDSIMTISKSRLTERITALATQKLLSVEAAVHFALGLET